MQDSEVAQWCMCVSDWKIDSLCQLCSVCLDNSLAVCVSPSSSSQFRRWIHQNHTMCYHVYVIILYVVRTGHCPLLAGFSLSIYSLHVLNSDVDMIYTITQLRCYVSLPHTLHKLASNTSSTAKHTVMNIVRFQI